MSRSRKSVEPHENLELPGYRLLMRVGSGAYGDVWLAEEVLTGVRRAIKFLPKTGSSLSPGSARELNGIRQYQLKTKGHPSLVQIHFADERSDSFFYVMDLADNAGPDEVPQLSLDRSNEHDDYRPLTLAAVIKRDAPLPPAEALAITEQIVEGLVHLHMSGLIHRDVKPSNVLVVGGQFKLGDVGLVTGVGEDATCLGTPGYVRPHAPLDQASDLYAVGMMLYEMITGLDRFRFPKLPVFSPRTRSERRRLRAAIRIFNKAAHPDRRQCYESAAQLLHDITASRSRGRRTSLRLLAGATVIFLVIAIIWARRPWTGRVVSVSLDEAVPEVLKMVFEDGRESQIRFQSPLGEPQIVDFAGHGNPSVAVGTRSSGEMPGRLVVFDPTDAATLKNAEFDEDMFLPPPWNHQPFVRPCYVSARLVANLDGIPGQELGVVAIDTGCPTRCVVYTKGMRVLSEYWHYGHLGYMEAADLDGDDLPELVCWGIANERKKGLPFGAITEKGHSFIMILDPRLRGPGHWSMNSWMNRPAEAPMAYGYVKEAIGARDGPWNVDHVKVNPSDPHAIRLELRGGLLLELDQDLTVQNIRLNSIDSRWKGPIPNPDDVWVRMWPQENASVKEKPSGPE